MLPKKIAFVDLETTGSSHINDHVIEIGIIRVEDNVIVSTYQSLINPQTYLSPFIADMTGITPEELESAPTFRQIREDIVDLLSDCVFVAHNVRFDYGFLRSEFRRQEISFSSKHFCTVKLFRHLYPDLPHHDLDSLITHFELDCPRRHRAFDDAHVLWQFYDKAQTMFSGNILEEAINLAMKKPTLPIGLSNKQLERIPETPGVYVFYDAQGLALYVGKSVNLRDRVMSHFSGDWMSHTDMKISQQISDIETFKTETELEALLLESETIKRLHPVHNRLLRHKRQLVITTHNVNAKGYVQAETQTVDRITPELLNETLVFHKSTKQAKNFLREMCTQFQLCPKMLGLEKGSGACFDYHLGKCEGACVNKENTLRYNIRMMEAFSRHKLKQWPFSSPIVIHNKLLIDKWCIVTEDQEYNFDVDTYKILSRFVFEDKNQKYIKRASTA
jgi:DNA polymerase III subunit epsilon